MSNKGYDLVKCLQYESLVPQFLSSFVRTQVATCTVVFPVPVRYGAPGSSLASPIQSINIGYISMVT